MALTPGTRIGPYEITSQLGAGGMGEVYRARDSRLKREVALKVLPVDVANDPERLARFQREAEVLASLNHPHIAQVYGIEDRALVMELVEGDDLSQRIARGPIPVDEALPIARQIAEALEAAHDAGIIHRDLKPANVKIREDGTVKVLDFGLAKALDPGTGSRQPGSGADPADSPTITSPAMTLRGVILGTAAYMSPEQAKGKGVDRRADVWAFGCLLYEMLTGRRPFHGDDVTDTIASVLRNTPDWNALPAATPAGIRTLLRRCIEKDPRQRAPHMSVARLAIEDAMAMANETVAVPNAARPRSGLSHGWVAALLAAAVAVTAVGVWQALRPADAAPRSVIRASWPFPDAVGFRLGLQRHQIALSRNAATIAVVGFRVMTRRLDQLTWTTVPGTEDATGVFASPDGEWIGYLNRTGISKVRASGGATNEVLQRITSSNLGPMAAAWGDDGRIYFTDEEGVHVVSAAGGPATTITNAADYTSIAVLPGSRMLLLTRGRVAADPRIVMLPSAGGEETLVTEGISGRFVAPDLLFFVRGTTLMGARFDVSSGRLTTAPVAFVEQLATLRTAAQYDIAADGTLVYIPLSSSSEGRSIISLRRTDNTVTPLTEQQRAFSDPRFSPDGRLLALHLFDQENDIWVFDMSRGSLARLTFDAREDETPAWSPDGRWIAFAGQVRDGTDRAIIRRQADGSGAEEVLATHANHSHVTDWSPDGKIVVIEMATPERRSDIHIVDVDSRTSKPLLATPFNEAAARISPDGKWMAYHSDESGRPEVYIRSFPGLDRKVAVSANGGHQPLWSRDGKAVYFRTETHFARAAVSQSGDHLALEPPVMLFPDQFLRPQAVHHTTYDVRPDGSFLVIQAPKEQSPLLEVMAVFNWLEEVAPKLR